MPSQLIGQNKQPPPPLPGVSQAAHRSLSLIAYIRGGLPCILNSICVHILEFMEKRKEDKFERIPVKSYCFASIMWYF